MSPYRDPAPRGFRWADRPVARAAVTLLAILSLLLSMFVGYRYVDLIDCLQHRAIADAARTKVISDAVDRERAADRALLVGPVPGGPSREELRRADLAARAETDRVRAANPAPPAGSAECG